MNMSFDAPVPIVLRVIPDGGQGSGPARRRPDYTFLYDWFGDTFHYERTETQPPYGDIVRVLCSPFAMVNWALQYSDRVEVLKPETVRKQVMEKVKNLTENIPKEVEVGKIRPSVCCNKDTGPLCTLKVKRTVRTGAPRRGK